MVREVVQGHMAVKCPLNGDVDVVLLGDHRLKPTTPDGHGDMEREGREGNARTWIHGPCGTRSIRPEAGRFRQPTESVCG